MENVHLRINRVVRDLDELTHGSLIGRVTSPSSSAVGGAVSFSLSSSSLWSPLAIPRSLLSSSVVKMMSDPSRVLGLECPWGNSHYRHHRRCMLVNHLSGLASHLSDTLCCTKFPPFTSICTSSRRTAIQKGETSLLQ